jgi:hypothetical protein
MILTVGQFHNEGECMAPLPLRIVFFQSQRLVDSAPRLTTLTLPAIHLSRALHHLVLSLAEAIAISKIEETMEAYFISRLNRLDRLYPECLLVTPFKA